MASDPSSVTLKSVLGCTAVETSGAAGGRLPGARPSGTWAGKTRRLWAEAPGGPEVLGGNSLSFSVA